MFLNLCYFVEVLVQIANRLVLGQILFSSLSKNRMRKKKRKNAVHLLIVSVKLVHWTNCRCLTIDKYCKCIPFLAVISLACSIAVDTDLAVLKKTDTKQSASFQSCSENLTMTSKLQYMS